MERLTTAYERIWVDGRTETEYAVKAYDLDAVAETIQGG